MVVAARNFGRALGLNRWIASYVQGSGYETRYDNRFTSTLNEGDCVWDVGANIGYYTRFFSQRIGENGIVYAFEPSPVNFARLTESCEGLRNVKLMPFALGRENAKLSFQQGSDDLGATSRVTGSAGGGQLVEVRSAMSLITQGEVNPPNAIKIDVEGFELEVLEGLADTLASPNLRVFGIEVHFRVLNERGMGFAPQQIVKLLHKNGFMVKWPDSSHILATRYTLQ